jgi:hypothetical protein
VTDSAPSPAPHTAAAAVGAGTERLSVPWWWWPPTLLLFGLLAAEVHMGYPGVRSWLPYLLLLPLGVAALVWLGRIHVGTTEERGERELVAGPAHLPVRLVGRMDVVAGPDKQRALGPDLDPTAHVLHRPWIGPAVRLEVLDPDDPTPYWVVSTRHPQRLIAAVRQGDPGVTAPG